MQASKEVGNGGHHLPRVRELFASDSALACGSEPTSDMLLTTEPALLAINQWIFVDHIDVVLECYNPDLAWEDRKR